MQYVCLKETIEPPFIGGAIAVCQKIDEQRKAEITIQDRSITTSKENLIFMGNSKEEVEANWTNIKIKQLPLLQESPLVALVLNGGKPERVMPVTGNNLFDLSCAMCEQRPWSWKSFAEFVDSYIREESKPAVYLWETDVNSFGFSVANASLQWNGEKRIPKSPLALVTGLYKISLALKT